MPSIHANSWKKLQGISFSSLKSLCILSVLLFSFLSTSSFSSFFFYSGLFRILFWGKSLRLILIPPSLFSSFICLCMWFSCEFFFQLTCHLDKKKKQFYHLFSPLFDIHRYQFFLQLKQDILQSRLPVPSELSAELFALVIQCKSFFFPSGSIQFLSSSLKIRFSFHFDSFVTSLIPLFCSLETWSTTAELGDFDAGQHLNGYVSEFRFIRNQSRELEARVSELHKRLV